MEISLISNLNRFRSWLWFILSFLFLNKDPKACCMYVTYQKKKSLFYVCMLLTGTSLPNASMIVAKEHYPKNQLSKKKKRREKDAIYLFVFDLTTSIVGLSARWNDSYTSKLKASCHFILSTVIKVLTDIKHFKKQNPVNGSIRNIDFCIDLLRP